jgi:hypothetical protein
MRIAFCGPSGAGKTTLAKLISEELDIPFVTSSSKDVLSNYEYLESFGYTMGMSHSKIIQLSNSNPDFAWEWENAVLSGRQDLVKLTPKATFDRTFIDNMAYYLYQAAPQQTPTRNIYFINKCMEQITLYDMIFFIQYIPGNEVENNGMRVSDPVYQAVSSKIFEHAINNYFRPHVYDKKRYDLIQVIDFWNLSQRKQFVLDKINNGLNR